MNYLSEFMPSGIYREGNLGVDLAEDFYSLYFNPKENLSPSFVEVLIKTNYYKLGTPHENKLCLMKIIQIIFSHNYIIIYLAVRRLAFI